MSRDLAGKVAKVTRKAERIRAKPEHHAAALDRLATHLESLDVWTRAEPGSRRPKLTRDDIAAAAVRVADAEGFEAVSMRRLATELGVGTMSLYHYVHTKDELLTLITDHIMGELLIPDDEAMPTDWREAVRRVAELSRQTLQAHPWIFDITDDPPIGPNAVRHFDQSLKAVDSLDATLAERLEIIIAVDEYVFGHCLHSRNNANGPNDHAAMHSYIKELLGSGEYPHLEALIAEQGFDAVWTTTQRCFNDEGRFDRNICRLLDGFYQR